MNLNNAEALKRLGLVDVDLAAARNQYGGTMNTTAGVGTLTGAGRQFLASLVGTPELRGIGQGAAPSAPSVSSTQGDAMAGATINLTVAPVINNPMLDTAARLEELKAMIVDAAKTAVGQAYSGSVDALILGGGAAS
jgi:hypothetical protein